MKHLGLLVTHRWTQPLAGGRGLTPWEWAKTPALEALMASGRCGALQLHAPRAEHPSTASCFALFGVNPGEASVSAALVEAASLSTPVSSEEVLACCDLVTQVERRIADPTAGGISDPEAATLFAVLNEALGNPAVQFQPGRGHRGLLRIRDPQLGARMLAQRLPASARLLGRSWSRHLPAGEIGKWLTELLERAQRVLGEHEVNRVRLDLQENPANGIWIWGAGSAHPIRSFTERFGRAGALVSDDPVFRGVGQLLGLAVHGLQPVKRRGKTARSSLGEHWKAGLNQAMAHLDAFDIVFLHLSFALEDLRGHVRTPVSVIEQLDRTVMGPVHAWLQASASHRGLLLLVDHERLLAPEPPDSLAWFVLRGAGQPGDPAVDKKTIHQPDDLPQLTAQELMQQFFSAGTPASHPVHA